MLAAGEGKVFAVGVPGESGHKSRAGAEIQEVQVRGFGDKELVIVAEERRRRSERGFASGGKRNIGY